MKEVHNDLVCSGGLDYHVEYNKLLEECHILTDKNEYLAHTVSALERDNAILRAQLDMVHLIFGGNR